MEKEKINQYIIGYSTDIYIKIMKVYTWKNHKHCTKDFRHVGIQFRSI